MSDSSTLSIAACSGSFSSFYVYTAAQVSMTGFAGTVAGMKVDGRSDIGPMGSCDGSPATYCSSWTTNNQGTAIIWPNGCSQNSATCDGEPGSCCATSGSAELCLSSWTQFDSTAPAGCRSLGLGAMFAVDAVTEADATFTCRDRYRGPLCDIVPKTCRNWYDTQEGKDTLRVQYSPNGNNAGYGNCDGTTSCSSYCNPDSFSYPARNNARCVNADTSC